MPTRAHKILLIAIGAAALLIVALAGCGGDEGSPSAPPSGEAASPDAGLRTVLVYDREPAPSPTAESLHAGLEEGQLPKGTVKATVLTDEDCAPDAEGISHCRNVVRAAGRVVTLRHPHDMQKVPCLAPGEKVLLRRL